MKSTLTYQTVWRRLAKIYGEGEAKALTRMVYELRYGLTLSDLYVGRDVEVSQDELEDVVCRLEQHEPIQYIIGVAEFCGRRFVVDRRVLIPRPETEELCGWVLSEKSSLEQLTGGCSILDVGTGSGCIAITLAAGIPQAKVTAWDLSDGALQVARMNAKRICVDVSFVQMDALNIPHTSSSSGSGYDIIVSNPPYIINKERANMEANVLDYEPHNALFVPDNDPLRFYRTISQYALVALRTDGWLYFEINPLYAEDLKLMLQTMGFHSIEVKKDQYGKQRMMRARR